MLIWQGASRLTWFHEPLEFPNGEKDSFNWMRPIIGYGPETMYVAFNPFYPPELGSIESRNATPDRSHNETWDALAITGWLGLATEQMVFLSFFFFGLKWLGMIGSSRQSKLFFSLTLGGGLVSTLLFAWAVDIGFIGVGLPFGILLGLLAYLTLIALFSKYEIPQSPGEKARALTLMMFVGAVIAHYVEIHFGIAIAATRLYFWVFYGVLLSAGYWMTLEGSFGTQAASQVEDAAISAAPARAGKRRIQKRTKSNRAAAVSPETRRFAWVSGLTGGILLSTLTYNYITNSGDVSEFGAIIANSLTVLPGRPGASYGILSIFLLIWIAIIVIAGSEWARNQINGSRYVVVSTAAISAGTWLLFTLMHTSGLVIVIQSAVPQASDTGVYDRIFRQVLALESMLTRYTFFLLVLIFTAAIPIALGGKTASQRPALSGKNTITLSGVFIILFYLIIGSNLRPVQADIAFKVGDSLSRSNTAESWQAALNLFKHANSLAPAQDHYNLYLGRGYLELTRNVQQTAPDQAQNLLLEAESDLKRAQGFNPLNTDHTANLARLYRFWSDIPGVSTSILLAEAEKYYQRALVLSPYNSGIRNELATLYLQNYGDSERGLETLKQSIEIDPFNDSTYATIGDYYSRLAAGNSDEAVIRTNIEQAADYYDIAIEKARGSSGRYLYATALASLYAYGDDIESARDYYLLALDNASANNRWQTEEALGKIHVQLEDYAQALDYAQDAYQHAPEASRASIQQLIDYIQASQETP